MTDLARMSTLPAPENECPTCGAEDWDYVLTSDGHKATCCGFQETILKKCGCGRAYTKTTWKKLEYVGLLDIDEDGDQRGEMRNCECGSTITIERE